MNRPNLERITEEGYKPIMDKDKIKTYAGYEAYERKTMRLLYCRANDKVIATYDVREENNKED